MSRPTDRAHTSIAAERIGRDIVVGVARHNGAPRAATLSRLALLPLAALGACVAGLIFVVLLPICGVATIAEGVALRCLEVLRGEATHARRDNVPQH